MSELATTLMSRTGVPPARLEEPNRWPRHRPRLVCRAPPVPAGAPTIVLENQLNDAYARIRTLETQEAHLLGQIRTLRAVITELTHEAEASNIFRLKPS